MTKVKLVIRRVVQLVISSFAMLFIMESFCMDLPIANYVGVYVFGAMTINILLLTYEAPVKKKRPVGNYFKEQR